jgi:hypothetical protein
MKHFADIQSELIKATRTWALGDSTGLAHAAELRNQAIRLNQIHYRENIPLYRKIAEEEGLGADADIATIKKNLMFSSDIFKSYEQSWLDDNNFSSMSQWLSSIYHRRIDTDVSGVQSIDAWIECLETSGVHVVYSSGTSGAFSFVPRDKKNWQLSMTANSACLSPLLAGRITGGLSQKILGSTLKLMAPDVFDKLAAKKMLSEFDAAFLGFRSGRMGNQALIEELSQLFQRPYFLYDIGLSGTALRVLRRGAGTEQENRTVEKLRRELTDRKDANYLKMIDNIRHSTKEGQKVFIFGAPHQFKELCEIMAAYKLPVSLNKGSLVLFGGGWKSFTGEAIKRETLVNRLTESLDISPDMVLEGYSMTEINTLMLRCKQGCFHIPPIIEPAVFDEEMNLREGKDIKGAFGFLDPMAVAYPGFIISNDYVHMIEGVCACGLSGPAITEIGRISGSEIKGCGGIMGSIQA